MKMPTLWVAKAMLFALAVALILTGCGGGGGSSGGGGVSALVGTFIDAPVSGLDFESESGGGITDANGNFTYRKGEKVTFRIGNLYLGSATPNNGKVTPLDLVGTADVNDPRVVRILRTMQSLDANAGTGKVIHIDATAREALRTQARTDLDKENDAGTDAKVKAMLPETAKSVQNDYKVSEGEAKRHFESHKDDESNRDKGYNPPPPPTPGTSGSHALIAWNDLGMHCVDGKDYSVFSILPPYNNLHAHLVDRTTNKQIGSGVTLTYESVADAAGSINTESATKTNFWNWVPALFGTNHAPNVGLTNKPTPSATPAAMAYNATHGWWEAEGLPITPYDDAGGKNYYPMVKVVARDAGGNVLASTKVVLPVSDEMSCKGCHESNGGDAAAKPTAGWVNDPDVEKDWKRNILRLHDQRYPAAVADAGKGAKYTAGSLLASADVGQPSLCADCHKSNALGTPSIGGIKSLTEALHAKHAGVNMPGTNTTLDHSTNRDSCYLCHPGSATKCLRGVMGNAQDANGKPSIDCQSCHGNLSQVGKAGREGWLDEPTCQHCHDRASPSAATFSRFLSVFSSGSTLRAKVDDRFASNADTPAPGLSLYRFSKGHGGLQCEACHGATHAEYPSSHANDNVQSLALQNHVGTIAECTVCHATVPTTSNKGPHGLHTIGQEWISQHESAAKGNLSACVACHGSDYRGTFLSKTSMARSFRVEGGNKTFAAGQAIGCYHCHNGPNGD